MARIFDAILLRRKNPRAGPANNGSEARARLRPLLYRTAEFLGGFPSIAANNGKFDAALLFMR
jgi:hypothetical protein